MLVQSILEASLIRANYILSQEAIENSFNSFEAELNSLSKILGIEFDKGLYILIFDQIDFKEPRLFLNSNSLRYQYFLKILQRDITKEKFVNFFAEILMKTRNNNSPKEIMETLKSLIKLTEENQLKILLSFVLSKNPNYYNEAILLLANQIKQLEKQNIIDKIEPKLSQDILFILSEQKNKTIKNDINLYSFNTISKNKDKDNNKKSDSLKLLSILESDDANIKNDLIPIGKLYEDLGPSFFNNCKTSLPKSPLIDYSLNAKDISELIINIIRKSPLTEDKEIRLMNKSFLKSLDIENEKEKKEESSDKFQMEWNIDNFYKVYKKEINSINPKEIFNYLDSPKLVIKDKKKFEIFLNVLKSFELIKDNNYELFFEFIFKKWKMKPIK